MTQAGGRPTAERRPGYRGRKVSTLATTDPRSVPVLEAKRSMSRPKLQHRHTGSAADSSSAVEGQMAGVPEAAAGEQHRQVDVGVRVALPMQVP